MRQSALFYLGIMFLLVSCSSEEKRITLDKRNFSIVNINYSFPIIDLSNLSYDSLGFTCERCLTKDNTKIYSYSVIIDGNKRTISYRPSGWTASYFLQYDTNGRIKQQEISSCFDWRISYNYLDTLGCIYQYSKIEGENPDTTIYKLDQNGRVMQINGIEYGDLFKRSFSKKIYYSNLSSIPDSIYSTFNRGKKKDEVRKEIFYQFSNKIDSIKSESIKFNEYDTTKYFVINYFDKDERFTSQRYINDHFIFDKYYVERLKKSLE